MVVRGENAYMGVKAEGAEAWPRAPDAIPRSVRVNVRVVVRGENAHIGVKVEGAAAWPRASNAILGNLFM